MNISCNWTGKKPQSMLNPLSFATIFCCNTRLIVVHAHWQLEVLWKRIFVREHQIKVQTWKIIVEVVG